jgi:hypothetical protein
VIFAPFVVSDKSITPAPGRALRSLGEGGRDKNRRGLTRFRGLFMNVKMAKSQQGPAGPRHL